MGVTIAFMYLKKFGPCFFLDCSKQLDLKAMVQGISIMLLSSEGAARKVSPDWSQETMTCHSSNCFCTVLRSGKRTVGDFSSEQLLIKKIFFSTNPDLCQFDQMFP